MELNRAKIRYPESVEAKIVPNNKGEVRSSLYTEDFKGEYYNISVEKLLPFRVQARSYFDEEKLNDLAETIKQHGIRQPLTIIPCDVNRGYYEVVSGERRLRAAKLAGLKRVPCIIIHDKKQAEEIAIIENIQREDLHPIELMIAYNNLLEHGICNSLSEVAKKVGVTKSSVVDIMNLKVLDLKVRDLLLKEHISGRDFLRDLCKIKDVRLQLTTISDFANVKKNSDKKHSKKSIKTKAVILKIYLEGKKIILACNKIKQLSVEQKSEIENLLRSFL